MRRMRVVADPAGDLLNTASLPRCSPGALLFYTVQFHMGEDSFLGDILLDRCLKR